MNINGNAIYKFYRDFLGSVPNNKCNILIMNFAVLDDTCAQLGEHGVVNTGDD